MLAIGRTRRALGKTSVGARGARAGRVGDCLSTGDMGPAPSAAGARLRPRRSSQDWTVAGVTNSGPKSPGSFRMTSSQARAARIENEVLPEDENRAGRRNG